MGYTISSKGQVTLPAEVRKRLGVEAGDEIEFVFENGATVIRPVRSEENPFEKWIGFLNPKGQPEGTAVKWVRSLRDDEEDTE